MVKHLYSDAMLPKGQNTCNISNTMIHNSLHPKKTFKVELRNLFDLQSTSFPFCSGINFEIKNVKNVNLIIR